MATTAHGNALMSDNDLERSSASPQGSFEYVVYESSDSDSVTLSGSEQAQTSQTYDDDNDDKAEGVEVLSDTETLPEYQPATAYYETTGLLAKGDYRDQDAAEQVDDRDNNKCSRRRCFGRRCRRRCRRPASMNSDKKRRIRRRIVLFIKGFMLLGLFSFFMIRMCLRRKIVDRFPEFEGEEEEEEEFSTPRRIIRNHYAEDISGQFPLYDLLALKTTSGNINVFVEPQPADPEYPDEPARLLVKTDSGSVSVSFVNENVDYLVAYDNGDVEQFDSLPDDFESLKNAGATSLVQIESEIPYRPYEVVISSRSGSIHGRIIFSSSVYLETQAGDISASLIPVVSLNRGDDAITTNSTTTPTTIVTKTVSGTLGIALDEPRFISSAETSSYNLAKDRPCSSSTTTISSHITESGNLQVQYPHSWAGNLTALHNWGPVALGGEGLEITESNNRYTKGFKRPIDNDEDETHKWWGSRGDMEVLLKTEVGAVNFVC